MILDLTADELEVLEIALDTYASDCQEVLRATSDAAAVRHLAVIESIRSKISETRT